MQLPGRALQGFHFQCVCMCVFWRNYWGRLCMAKWFCWLCGKSVTCLLLPLLMPCLEASHMPHMVALWLNIFDTRSSSHLITSSLFHLCFIYRYLQCPLVPLSVFAPVLTEAEWHTICRGHAAAMYFTRGNVLSALPPPCIGCDLAWLHKSRHTHLYLKVWTYGFKQDRHFNVNPEYNEFHYNLNR